MPPRKPTDKDQFEDLKHWIPKPQKDTDQRGILDGIIGNDDTVMRAPEDWPPPPGETNEKSSNS